MPIREAQHLRVLHRAAIAGLVLLVPAAAVVKIWTEDFAIPVHHWALMTATALVLLFWVAASSTELQILTTWLSPAKYVAPSGIQVAAVFALLAVFLAFLVYAVMNIQLYAFLYTVFAGICALTNSVWAQTEIAFAEQESRAALPRRNPSGTRTEDKQTEASYIAHDAIREFWANGLGRIEKKDRYLLVKYRLETRRNWLTDRYFLRHVAYVPACFTVWVLAVIAEVYTLPWLELVCYWMMVSIIAAGEGVLFIWRLSRDNRIREAGDLAGAAERERG